MRTETNISPVVLLKTDRMNREPKQRNEKALK